MNRAFVGDREKAKLTNDHGAKYKKLNPFLGKFCLFILRYQYSRTSLFG